MAARRRPGLLESGRVPEDVARVGERRAARQVRIEPVDDADGAGHDQEDRGAGRDGALVHDKVPRLEPLDERRRQGAGGTAPRELGHTVGRHRRQEGDRRGQGDPDTQRHGAPPGRDRERRRAEREDGRTGVEERRPRLERHAGRPLTPSGQIPRGDVEAQQRVRR